MNDLRTAIRLVLGTTLSNREIGRQLEISYNTIRRHRETAVANNYQLDDLVKLSDAELNFKFNTYPPRSKQKRMPDWPYVHQELQRKGVTRTLLWMEYSEEDPETAYQLSQFNQLYAAWAGKQALSMRQQYEPGERGWADFSDTLMQWVDPTTGECHDAEIFIGSVSVSGLLFALTARWQWSRMAVAGANPEPDGSVRECLQFQQAPRWWPHVTSQCWSRIDRFGLTGLGARSPYPCLRTSPSFHDAIDTCPPT